MKNLSYLLRASVFLAFLVCVGCKKDQNTGVIPASNTGSWKLSSFQVAPALDGTTDLINYYNSRLTLPGSTTISNCYGGIVYTFGADGTIKLTYPSPTCVQGSDYSYFDNGDKWSVDGSRLLIDGIKTGKRVFDLETTSASMKLTYKSTSKITGQDITSTYTATFNK